jgi:hypothetical protein
VSQVKPGSEVEQRDQQEEVSVTLKHPPKTFGGAGTEDGVDEFTA